MTHFSIPLFRLLKIAVGWIEFPCPTIIFMVCHTGSGVGTTAGREIRVEAKLPARDLSLLPQRRSVTPADLWIIRDEVFGTSGPGPLGELGAKPGPALPTERRQLN
jgi:hypothetical protein